jgi:hypothetical protein
LPLKNLHVFYGYGIVFYYGSPGSSCRIYVDGYECEIAAIAFGGASSFSAFQSMMEPSKFCLGARVGPRNRPRNGASIFLRITVLRTICAIALGLAVSTGVILVVLRVVHCLQPRLFPWTLKSAVPLILIGVAFACLQFVVARSRAQVLLGLLVAAAFILWGTEQFLSNHAIVSFIDDVVVFLFVLDLGMVIYGHLKPGTRAHSPELPLDSPDD